MSDRPKAGPHPDLLSHRRPGWRVPCLQRWDEAEPHAAEAHGARWVEQKRSPILFVPSAVCRTGPNVLVNPAHADFPRIQPSLHRPVIWDHRLFGGQASPG